MIKKGKKGQENVNFMSISLIIGVLLIIVIAVLLFNAKRSAEDIGGLSPSKATLFAETCKFYAQNSNVNGYCTDFKDVGEKEGKVYINFTSLIIIYGKVIEGSKNMNCTVNNVDAAAKIFCSENSLGADVKINDKICKLIDPEFYSNKAETSQIPASVPA